MDIVSYAMGEGAGYKKGYADGQDSDAYTAGYDTGYSEGYTSGYDAGFPDGTQSFYTYVKFKGSLASLFAKYSSGSTKLITNTELREMLKYDIARDCTDTSVQYMFLNQYLITEIPEFDTKDITNFSYLFSSLGTTGFGAVFNNGGHPPLLNTSSASNINFMFAGALGSESITYNNMDSVPLYDFTKVINARGLFFKCSKIKEIPAYRFDSIGLNNRSFDFANSYSTDDWLHECVDLERIKIKDIHYRFNVSESSVTKLNREALLEIIGNLRDMTGSTSLTLTLGATNLAKLTEEDIALATEKNWTVA